MNLTIIGKRIKQLRQQRDLTQEQFAQKIGVTWEMISRYERGRSSPLLKLLEIADVLGVSTSELIDDTVADSGTQHVYSPVAGIPLLLKLPSETKLLEYELSVTPYRFVPSMPIDRSEGGKLFAIDIHHVVANLQVKTDNVFDDGFIVCEAWNGLDLVPHNTYLFYKSGFIVSKYNPQYVGAKVIARVISYTRFL